MRDLRPSGPPFLQQPRSDNKAQPLRFPVVNRPTLPFEKSLQQSVNKVTEVFFGLGLG